MLTASVSSRTLHFRQPATTSRGVYTDHRSYYVTLERDGLRGIGECSFLPDLSCDAMPHDRYLRILSDALAHVEHTEAIPYDLLRPYPSMLFGIESAFRQLQAGGSPALSQTPFSRGEEGICINGLVWMGSFEEMYARLQEKLEAGFRCVKLKIGAIDWEREVELLRHIRRHFSRQQIEIRVDANGAFTPYNAMERLHQLASFDIHSIEQPVRQGQWELMAHLCRHTPLPIALDEELIGVNTADGRARLLDAIRPQYIVLKPSLHGGAAATREWVALARERAIGSWITSALESNVGLNAVAHLCAEVYGPQVSMPQGLGTGMLYTDNIPMPLHIKGDKLWFSRNF